MADNYQLPQFVMELTVLSVENLKKPASCGLFSPRLRPFISVTKSNGDNNLLCKRDVENFPVGDRFLVPIESHFFANNSCIYLQLHTKRLLGRLAQLSWCQIPAADIREPPVGSVRRLSYRLRDNDGSMGNRIVHLQVKLECYGCLVYSGKEVIGTPVTILPKEG